MNVKNFIPAVLAILGLSDFRESEGKKFLSEEDKAALKEHGFQDKFIDALSAAMNETAGNPDSHKEVSVVAAMLAQVTAECDSLRSEVANLKSQSGADAALIASKEAEIAALQEKVSILADLPENDPAPAAGRSASAEACNLADDKQLGGRQGVIFGLDRAYNQRARAALLARQGIYVQATAESAMDYSMLREDLGAFYRQPWRDRLQSFLTMLPTIETLFPVESGYQDLATLSNVFLGEFSQAENTEGSDFDNVSKGSFVFGHETLRMFGVMFSHKFRDLKKIEKLWIGSLNKEGSAAIKWSFIEYLLAEVAKKLHNEREQRRVNGVRKNPTYNKPGKAMEAADGIYEFLRKKVDGHIDYTVDGGTTGKVVYQLKPFVLGRITEANIGEVFYKGTAMVPAQYRDTGSVVLYVPSYMLPWYHKYNEMMYGVNKDYTAGQMYVHEFPNVKIAAIPNADGHQRIFWTIDGNIKCYEDKPGEMLNFSLEQQDWGLKVWSIWKESIWAEAVGFKYTDPNLMDGSRQMIWLNEYDLPETQFVLSEPDENPSVLRHTSVETAPNSALYTITDIVDAKVGVVVTIKAGADGEHGVKISKANKFSLLAADWNPAKGDVIKLMKRADGKFIEIARTTAADNSFVFDANATTPSVAGATVFAVAENSETTAITDLKDAVVGTVYTIYGAGSTNASTIATGGKFALTAAMTLSAGKFIKLAKAADGKFYEVERG